MCRLETNMARPLAQRSGGSLVFFQHDGAATFRFVLIGRLYGRYTEDLEHAWTTARSVINGKELVVDVSSVTGMDAAGSDLLSRMRNSGARVVLPTPPETGSVWTAWWRKCAAAVRRLVPTRLPILRALRR
jgi:hypothetical protein